MSVIDTQLLHLEMIVRSIAGEAELSCVSGVLADVDPVAALGAEVDAVLVCAHHPGFDLLAQVSAARSSHPSAVIVVVAGYVDAPLAEAAAAAGADLVLPTSTSLGMVLGALRGLPCSSAISTDRDEAAQRAAVNLGLTRRQHEVLRHLADGNSPRQIAEMLTIKLDTCRDHIRALHRVLGCSSTTEVVIVSARIGLLPALGRPLR